MTHQTRTPYTVMDQHGVVAGPVRLDTARPLHSCGLWPSRATHSRPGQAGWPLIEHILSHTVCIRMLFNVIERTTRGTSLYRACTDVLTHTSLPTSLVRCPLLRLSLTLRESQTSLARFSDRRAEPGQPAAGPRARGRPRPSAGRGRRPRALRARLYRFIIRVARSMLVLVSSSLRVPGDMSLGRLLP
jgi:hypothetical protein